MARPGRLELPTLCLEGRRSIQLSYGRNRIDSKTFALRRHSLLDVDPLRGEQTLTSDTRGAYSPELLAVFVELFLGRCRPN